MYNIVKTQKVWLAISGITMLLSIAALIMWGLKIGIDFTGGTLMQVKFQNERPVSGDVEKVLVESGIENIGQIAVQPTGDQEHIFKVRQLSNDERQKVLDTLSEKYGTVEETRFESIGPSVGKELQNKAYGAIIFVLLAIIIYISWAFRKVSKGPVPSYIYGASAILALAHDLLIVIGVFSFLGHTRGVEVDSLFITALLTILGFSVHDTIVVYDRIREQLKSGEHKTFEDVINASINTTMARSINTSLTTLIVLTALFLFGGFAIHYFVLALIIGIISGTYSSIFVASPLLIIWEKVLQKRKG